MIEAYRGLKSARMQLDYDDLIYGARDLLTNRDMTPWVLFKLDGGLDHILVDESARHQSRAMGDHAGDRR